MKINSKINKKIAKLLFLALALIAVSILGQIIDLDFTSSTPTQAKVIRVIDGDTIEVQYMLTKEKVRLIGVDTPETKHPKKSVQFYGEEASQFTTSQLLNKTIYLEYDVTMKDKYNRTLAYVWLYPDKSDKRKMFNSILLLEGYAKISTVPPNVKYVEYFKKYQTEAREQNKGLWNK